MKIKFKKNIYYSLCGIALITLGLLQVLFCILTNIFLHYYFFIALLLILIGCFNYFIYLRNYIVINKGTLTILSDMFFWKRIKLDDINDLIICDDVIKIYYNNTQKTIKLKLINDNDKYKLISYLKDINF
jgi:hypothetical protein